MGMFDKPQFLTGKNQGEGFIEPGDTFWLHNARIDGTSRVSGETRDQAKLLVSRERDGEQVVVFTTGTAIVGQVRRMDNNDRSKLPMEVRLDQKESGKGNPTNLLTPASDPPPGDMAEGAATF